MPVYDYRCHSCNIDFERTCKIDERLLQRCPVCSKTGHLMISTRAKPVCLDYYDTGLGEYVTGPRHRAAIMKQKGLENSKGMIR